MISRKLETKSSLSPNKGSRPSTSESGQNALSTGFQKKGKKALPEIQRKGQKADNLFQFMQNSVEFQDILLAEKDERYRYLVKHGTIRRIENGGNIIFSELPQIQGVWVCYRRPIERQNSAEKLCLDYLDLVHIPLLEGEEKLKILTYQHNRIGNISNLVSLPNLLYLDLYDNQIKEIEELKQVAKLKVLLLPKNQIRKIQSIDHLAKLEVLDLHSNRIGQIEGLSKLKNLRILNLGNNVIAKIENLEELNELVELNLKINQIESIDHLTVLPQLQKLYLSQNKINTYPTSLSLTDLSLDNNPISSRRQEYLRFCFSNYDGLKVLDGKPIESFRAELITEPPRTDIIKQKKQVQALPKVKKPNQLGLEIFGLAPNESKVISEVQPMANQSAVQKNSSISTNTKEEDVLSLIKKQWSKEFQKISELEAINQLPKKLYHQVVEGGHAEVEEDIFLLCYGTAFQIVLTQQNFEDTIERIHFQYILYDALIEQQLSVLKRYHKLKEMILKDNYIQGLIQIAKLEVIFYYYQQIQSLKSLVIGNNPICNCSFMFHFLVYRFPQLIQINGKDVRQDDKQRAKSMFQLFDKVLQIPERHNSLEHLRQFKSFQKDKQYIKTFQKTANEIALSYKYNPTNRNKNENQIDNYIVSLITKCKADFAA